MRKLIPCPLSRGAQLCARLLSNERTAYADRRGLVNQKRSKEDRDVVQLNDVGAEIAFAIWMNVCPDLDCDRPKPVDCVLPTGHTVDVKQSSESHWPLLVDVAKRAKATDLYAQMVGKFPTFYFAGFATKEQVFRADNIKGPNHVVPLNDLIGPEVFEGFPR